MTIETVADGEVEPGILGLFPLFEPLLPAIEFRNGFQGGLSIVGIFEGWLKVQVHSSLCQFLEFIIWAEQFHIHTLNHGCDRLVGNIWEGFFTKVEEV